MRHFYILIIALFFLGSCASYKQVSLSSHELLENEQIRWNFNKYNVYVHDQFNSARLVNPEMKDSTVTGQLNPVFSPTEAESIKNPQKRKDRNRHKTDLHLYVDNLDIYSANSNEGVTNNSSVKIDKKSIRDVKMYALDKQKTFASIALVIILVLVAIVVLLLLIWGLVSVIGKGSDASSGTSNSNSGGSSN